MFSTCLVCVKSRLSLTGDDTTSVLSQYLEVFTLDTGISDEIVVLGVDSEEGVRLIFGSAETGSGSAFCFLATLISVQESA